MRLSVKHAVLSAARIGPEAKRTARDNRPAARRQDPERSTGMSLPGAILTVPAPFAEIEQAADTRRQVRGLWARRAVIALFCAVVVLALADRFGQQPTSSIAGTPAASLQLSAPEVVRGGLFFQSRLQIRAARRIAFPRIVLDDGWVEGMQVNSIEPAPASESSRDGRLVLSYDKLAAGDLLRIWLQFEVNPTNVGHRPYGVELDDASTRLVRLPRAITVLP